MHVICSACFQYKHWKKSWFCLKRKKKKSVQHLKNIAFLWLKWVWDCLLRLTTEWLWPEICSRDITIHVHSQLTETRICCMWVASADECSMTSCTFQNALVQCKTSSRFGTLCETPWHKSKKPENTSTHTYTRMHTQKYQNKKHTCYIKISTPLFFLIENMLILLKWSCLSICICQSNHLHIQSHLIIEKA